MGILLGTTPKIMANPWATWSDCKHHNMVKFFVCVFRNSSITLSKVDSRRTSNKAINLP